MRKLLVISDNYPSSLNPTKGMFVYKLMDEFSKENEVEVIVPTVKFKKSGKKIHKIEKDKRKAFFPTYYSFSKFSLLKKISRYSKQKSILKSFEESITIDPDFIYVHFLWNAIAAIPLKNKINKPMFVAMGESSTDRYSQIIKSKDFKDNVLSKIDGFICVSQKIYEYVIETLGIDKRKVILLPNGVDNSTFYPMDKMELRKELNISPEKFVISFIGAFIERKGIHDLLLAVKDMDNVGLICIGKGELSDRSKVIFGSTLNHDKISSYIGASDVFVFPTRAEGSSNALLEAMACGLPIITTNIPEVLSQVGEGNAMFVSVGNIPELIEKINLFKDENLRAEYAEKSLEVAKKYSLNKRANTILNWIYEKI